MAVAVPVVVVEVVAVVVAAVGERRKVLRLRIKSSIEKKKKTACLGLGEHGGDLGVDLFDSTADD